MTKTKPSKVPVSRRAVEQRINRALAKDGEKLLRSRSNGMFATLGDYYIVSTRKNVISEHHVDLLDKARELEVLEKFETYFDEKGEK
jgi:hypothetical protein